LKPGPDGVVRVRDDMFAAKMNRKQKIFFDLCNEPGSEEILFDGSIRAGKTQAACKIIAAWAWKYGGPNWRFVVLRKTYRELADSTQAAFWKGDGRMPPSCPPELVERFYAKDETVILKNGAQILFRSAENAHDAENKIRNVTMAGFFIDQVEEFDGEDYFQLYETLLARLSDPRGPRKGLLVANPGPEDHWVYKRFVDERTKEPQTRRVSVTLYDNEHNLPRDYIRKMVRRKETNPLFYRRYILGEWGAFGGKRFPTWDPKVHVVEPFDIPAGWEVVCAIDYGWSNPTAVIWCAIDFDGRWYVVAEHYEKEKPVSVHVRAMKAVEAKLNISPSSVWMDPSVWARRSEYESTALEFADFGLYAARAQNDRLGGWNRIEEMLTQEMADKLPQLRVFNTCQNLIRELPSAKIKEGTDDIEKENDHALDALRYAIMSRMPVPEERLEDEEPHDLRLARHFKSRADKQEKLRLI
jgi:PBSX family phage terminase large subunit